MEQEGSGNLPIASTRRNTTWLVPSPCQVAKKYSANDSTTKNDPCSTHVQAMWTTIQNQPIGFTTQSLHRMTFSLAFQLQSPHFLCLKFLTKLSWVQTETVNGAHMLLLCPDISPMAWHIFCVHVQLWVIMRCFFTDSEVPTKYCPQIRCKLITVQRKGQGLPWRNKVVTLQGSPQLPSMWGNGSQIWSAYKTQRST
jgi:hypothetical protein